MKVKRLPRDPGPAGWDKLLGEPEPATPLNGNTTADWLVIGAGFAGLAAARRLSQLGPSDRIVVLDATRVGAGPAGRNSGFMIDLPHDLASDNYAGGVASDRAQIEDNRRAIRFAKDWMRDIKAAPEALVDAGKINAAATEKGQAQNAAFAKHLSALGEAHEWCDAQDMRDLTGTTYYKGGLFTPGTAMIQPALFVRTAAASLRSNSVSLHENSPVTALERAGDDWCATTPKGRVTAPRVILAVNGHLESFGHMAGRLMHIFTYASMTRALTAQECAALGGQPVWGVTPADPMGSTVRRLSGTGGDRIVVRNRFTFDSSMEVDEARIARVAKDHDAAFAARFPMLRGVEMAYRWGGRLCVSYNNVQIVQELEPGLWSACCQNGLGTAKGTLAGLLAAEAAHGIRSPALDRILAQDAPKKLPPAPLARVGANARLRWGEWRAGREF